MVSPVVRLTARGVVARKFRILLTTLAVVSGVAFVSGAFVLTDSVKAAIDNLFEELRGDIDLEVRTTIAFGDEARGERDPVPLSLLPEISKIEGVRLVEANLRRSATIIKADGEPLKVSGPAFGIAWDGPEGLDGRTLIAGTAPKGTKDVAIDKSSAKRAGYEIGDIVTIVGPTGKDQFTLVGLTGSGNTNGGGASISAFNPDTANDFLGAQDQADSLLIGVLPGFSLSEVQASVEEMLPESIEVITGVQAAKEISGSINDVIDIFGKVLLGFAAISLFVSAFLIFNTFAIIVSQRLRELALMRAVGASTQQIRAMIIGEGLIIGIIATGLGILGGLGVAQGITALFNAAGAAFPTAGLTLSPRTILVSVFIGIGVTVTAAIVPAIRASRIPPVAAMRPELGFSALQRNKRLVVGLTTLLFGIILFSIGLFVQPGGTIITLASSAIGAVMLFLGVASLSTTIAAPASRLISRILPMPFRPMTRSVPGRLASRNAQRTPRRTASTASALMVGLALVSTVSVVAASVKKSFTEQLQSSVTADFFITNLSFQGLPVAFAERLDALDELGSVSPFRATRALVNGEEKQIGAVKPEMGDIVDVGVIEGSIASLAEGKLLLHRDPARDLGLGIGDSLDITWQNGTTATLIIGGIYTEAAVAGNWLISLETLSQASKAPPVDFFIGAKIANGVSVEDARVAVERVARDFPSAEVQDQSEFQKSQEDQLNQLLAIVYGLLIFAILIAVLGIANTMALSVYERTREFGLLRAVGMSKRHLKRSVRWEAIIVSVFGATLGVVVGIPLGVSVAMALPDSFVTTTQIPVNTIVAILLASIVVGIVAAIFPARRAAKLDVLAAIATQ